MRTLEYTYERSYVHFIWPVVHIKHCDISIFFYGNFLPPLKMLDSIKVYYIVEQISMNFMWQRMYSAQKCLLEFPNNV